MFARQATTLVRPSIALASTARAGISSSFVRFLSNETRAKISKAVQADPLVVFMKGSPSSPQCGFSRAVLQILQTQGVNPDKVATYNCLEDDELRSGIKEYSDWPTIPQVYVNGEFIGGCDIMMNSTYSYFTSVHQSGELEQLLRDARLLGDDNIVPEAESKEA